MARPLVSVQICDNEIGDDAKRTEICMPHVFLAPIRPDLINWCHTQMNKNHRQPYAVNKDAGHQHSAESWGTGRAVSRIPRVSGGGTSRAGQGAFGNMCRSGRMFAPTKTWRRWHRKLNLNQKRYAVSSALAATALPALVMSRGHLIDEVEEIPLVVDDSIQSIKTTKEAIVVLKKIGAYKDCERVRKSKTIRAGRGKSRNRRYVHRLGPLIIYSKDDGIRQSFRNLTGVECANVMKLNLLRLAPGGRVGRFVIWTESAFKKLKHVFGSTTKASVQKKGFVLPRMIMDNSDIARIINSAEVQQKIRPKERHGERPRHIQKKNPLKNLAAMIKLNPYALTLKRQRMLKRERRLKGKIDLDLEKRKRKKKELRKFLAAQKKINYQRLVQDNFVPPAEKLVPTKEKFAHWFNYSHFRYLKPHQKKRALAAIKAEKLALAEEEGTSGGGKKTARPQKKQKKEEKKDDIDYAAIVQKKRTYDNDPCMGKSVSPSLVKKLDYVPHEVGGVAVNADGPAAGQPILVLLWGKYDKNTYQFMPFYADIDVAFPGIYVVGVSVAMDKKNQIPACLKNSLDKSHKDYTNYSNFQTTLPLAWDKGGKLQAAIEAASGQKLYNLPAAYLINSAGKIVWWQDHSQCATTIDVKTIQTQLVAVMKQQCAALLATGKVVKYGDSEVESSSEDEGESLGDGDAMADFLG